MAARSISSSVCNQPAQRQPGPPRTPRSPSHVSTGSLQRAMHDGSLLTACSAFLTANKWPELRSSAVPGCQLCSGCTRDTASAMPVLTAWPQSWEQVWFWFKYINKQTNKIQPNYNKKSPFYSKVKEACGQNFPFCSISESSSLCSGLKLQPSWHESRGFQGSSDFFLQLTLLKALAYGR